MQEDDNVVRRSKQDVTKYASFEELLGEVRAKGFQLIETGDQYVVEPPRVLRRLG